MLLQRIPVAKHPTSGRRLRAPSLALFPDIWQQRKRAKGYYSGAQAY